MRGQLIRPAMKYSAYGKTDPGMVRPSNEDALLVDEDHGVFAVADGLGGLPNGELASSLAIENLKAAIQGSNGKIPDFDRIFQRINQIVCQEGIKIGAEMGIGTTLTALALRDKKGVIGHVGDCALFLLRDNQIKQLTSDHTMEEEILSTIGDGPAPHIPEHYAHTLTRCIGQPMGFRVDVFQTAVQPKDRLFLCSDGVTKVLSLGEIQTLAKRATKPAQLVEALIAEANERGGPDNITAIAIFAED